MVDRYAHYCFWLFLSALLSLVTARLSVSHACTTFLMDQNGPVVGKSYDYRIGVAMVVVNKRGVSKQALLVDPQDNPAQWTSRYASITFNQYGREMPQSGMNEAGLMVEIMWLSRTEYPAADDRPTLNEVQWIQYALDNFSSVDEMAQEAPNVRIAKVYADVHYLACDREGVCAVFEYLNGQLVLTTGADMLVKTLTNSTYADSAEYLVQHEGFGGDQSIPTGTGSLERFVRASALALEDPTQAAPDSAFSILDSVSQGDSSKWNLVYVPADGRVYFRTYDAPTVKWIDIAHFDLNCPSGAEILDIDLEGAGDVSTDFFPYTTDANRELLEVSMESIIDQLPPGVFESMVSYPESTTCTIDPDGGDGNNQDGGHEDGTDTGSPDADRTDAGQEEGDPGEEPGGDSGCGCASHGRTSGCLAFLVGLLLLALPSTRRSVVRMSLGGRR